jgi:hypothetical protein
LCALYIHCGILDLLYHFLHGEYLCEKQTDRRQGRTLDFVARQAGHAARGGSVAEKKDPEVTHHGLTCGGVAAHIGFDAGDHDRVNAPPSVA